MKPVINSDYIRGPGIVGHGNTLDRVSSSERGDVRCPGDGRKRETTYLTSETPWSHTPSRHQGVVCGKHWCSCEPERLVLRDRGTLEKRDDYLGGRGVFINQRGMTERPLHLIQMSCK